MELDIIFDIAARDNNMPARIFYNISMTCRDLYNIVQWRLARMRRLYTIMLPKFARRFREWRMRRKIDHPITYSGRAIHTLYIEKLDCDFSGHRISRPINDDNLVYAFTNICFLTDIPLYAVSIHLNVFHIGGTLCKSQLIKEGRDCGKYFTNANLPTRFNPIAMAPEILAANDIRVMVYGTMHGIVMLLQYDYITHAFIHFKTVPRVNYDWDDYIYAINPKEIKQRKNQTTSFLKVANSIKETDIINDEVVQNIFIAFIN